MSDPDQDQDDQNVGKSGMGEHVQRYKEYMDNLKRGHSSGISAEFGSASSLLPGEFLESAQKVLGESAKVVATERESAGSPLESSMPIGTHSASSVTSSTQIGEKLESEPETETEVDSRQAADAEDFQQTNTANDEHSGADAMLSGHLTEQDSQEYDGYDSSTSYSGYSDSSADNEAEASTTSEHSEAASEEADADNEPQAIAATAQGPEIIPVETDSGDWLYDITFEDGFIPSQVRMRDGEIIKRACGSNRFVMSIPTDGATGGAPSQEYFILDTLVICPRTLNVYTAVHEGGYNAYFLNNGWQVHQYKIAEEQLNFVSEPFQDGESSRRTYQVENLEIDIAAGSIAFTNPAHGAVIQLTSRRL